MKGELLPGLRLSGIKNFILASAVQTGSQLRSISGQRAKEGLKCFQVLNLTLESRDERWIGRVGAQGAFTGLLKDFFTCVARSLCGDQPRCNFRTDTFASASLQSRTKSFKRVPPSTTSTICEQLLRERWILEAGQMTQPRGRPSISLFFEQQRGYCCRRYPPAQASIAIVDMNGRSLLFETFTFHPTQSGV